MDITKLKIKGFRYQPDVTSALNGVFYESVETEDDYIEITVDSLNPNKYVVSVVFGCETVKLYSTDAENLENTIKMFI